MNVLLLDVVPSSIVIKGSDGTYSNLLPKNTTIPTKKSTDFTLEEIKEKYTPFEIVEFPGLLELNDITENSIKTLFYKENLLSDQQGTRVNVVIDIDANMIFEITYKFF